MPLNDDSILGKLTDSKTYPGDSQEDLNLDLMLTHDQHLLIQYIQKHIGRYTLEDLLNDLRESDDVFWDKVLRRIISVYSLENLDLYVTDTPITNFSQYIIDLLIDLKITLLDDILEGKIKKDITREELETVIKDYKSVLLRWSIRFIVKDDYKKFLNQVFKEYFEPIYIEGDEN